MLLRRDKKETLTQNYRRLGLTSRLKAPAGGVEKSVSAASHGKLSAPRRDPLAIDALDKAAVSSARVERDASGKIIKIHYEGAAGRKPKANPLNDPLRQFDSDSSGDEDEDDEEEWGGVEENEADKPEVLRLLEEEAARPEEKKPRHQSEQETEWLERLVARHGDDFNAMAWDRKLNPMQQTAADIRRRVKKWKAGQ